MKDFLTNEWFVGIVSGLICAFITFVITKAAGTIRHKHQIEEANRFIVAQLRTYIVNGGHLLDELLPSLLHSAARKFKLKYEELLSPIAYLEEVASEITGNVYLRTDQQQELLSQISRYIQHEQNKELNSILSKSYCDEDVHTTAQMIGMLSMSLALIVAGIYAMLTAIPQLSANTVGKIITSGIVTLSIIFSVVAAFPRKKK